MPFLLLITPRLSRFPSIPPGSKSAVLVCLRTGNQDGVGRSHLDFPGPFQSSTRVGIGTVDSCCWWCPKRRRFEGPHCRGRPTDSSTEIDLLRSLPSSILVTSREISEPPVGGETGHGPDDPKILQKLF